MSVLDTSPARCEVPAGQGRHAEEQSGGQEAGRDGRRAGREARPGAPLQRAVRDGDPDAHPADALREGHAGQEPPLRARGDEPPLDRGRGVAAAQDRRPRRDPEPHRVQAGEGPGADPLSPGVPSVRRIAFVNEKGGTGKTTLAVHVAAWIARTHRQRVLLVDLDTQGHAGKTLGLDVREIQPNVFHFLTDRSITLEAVRHPTEISGLSVLPAYKQMAGLAESLGTSPSAVERLSERLDEFSGQHDVVVLDGPPSLGLSVTGMLVAATEVVVPVALTYLALDGCAEVARTVERVAGEYHRPGLRVTAVVPMMHRHTALAEAVRERLEAYFPGRVTPPLGVYVAIDEAQSHGKTVWDYAPKSRGASFFFASSAVSRASSSSRRRLSWARSDPRAGRLPVTLSTSDLTRSSARRCQSSMVRWPARRRSSFSSPEPPSSRRSNRSSRVSASSRIDATRGLTSFWMKPESASPGRRMISRSTLSGI